MFENYKTQTVTVKISLTDWFFSTPGCFLQQNILFNLSAAADGPDRQPGGPAPQRLKPDVSSCSNSFPFARSWARIFPRCLLTWRPSCNS